jgi:hypothetical protein
MHIVAGEVQRNQSLEDDSPAGERGREENEEAGSGASIRDHVKDSAESSRLLEDAGKVAIEGIEQAGDAV